jgi:hypothetical protein
MTIPAVYEEIFEMPPRDGLKFATKYVKQRASDREILDSHLRAACELVDIFLDESKLYDWSDLPHTDLTKHRGGALNGTHYGVLESVTDVLSVQIEKTGKGRFKDYPLAKLERWNRAMSVLSERPEAQNLIPETNITWQQYFEEMAQIELTEWAAVSHNNYREIFE